MHRLSEGDLMALLAASSSAVRQQEVRVRFWLSKKGLKLQLQQQGWFAQSASGNQFGPYTLDQLEQWAKA